MPDETLDFNSNMQISSEPIGNINKTSLNKSDENISIPPGELNQNYQLYLFR